MNHKLLRMIEEAGFQFTPDVMAKLPEFEKLVCLEREACAKVCENMCGPIEIYNPAYVHYVGCAEAIRARGQE